MKQEVSAETNSIPELLPLKEGKFNEEQEKCKVGLLENFLLSVVPLLVGIGDLDVFMVAALLLMVFRLSYLLSKRQLYTRWELFKECFNRLTWLSFTLIYCIYWILEKVEVDDPTEEAFLSFLKNLGIASVLIILIEILGETLFVVIDLLIWVGKRIFIRIKIYLASRKENKVAPVEKEVGK